MSKFTRKELRDLKSRWVAALRSGDYSQGQYRLKDTKEEKYCCLGVLCQILTSEELNKLNMKFENGFIFNINYNINYNSENASNVILPYSMISKLSFPIGLQGHLANANDSGVSFNEIADQIESNPELMARRSFLERIF